MSHTSVLLQESVDGLDIKKGDVVVDGTLGAGGHSEEIVKRFGDTITLITIDMDEQAIKRSRDRILKFSSNVYFIKDNFRNIDKALQSVGMEKADRILLDIGLSSNQLEESGRGFTFRNDEPLEMTFGEDPASHLFNARDIVNGWEEESIADVIFAYGEERFSRRIAKGIVTARSSKPINTTFELRNVILDSVPAFYLNNIHRGKIDPATKTFQALRITVNDELGALKEGLAKGFDSLNQNGRLAVISFHSLEDRIVKHYFNDLDKQNRGVIITKKPITPGTQELHDNPRSRSSKLRIIEKK